MTRRRPATLFFIGLFCMFCLEPPQAHAVSGVNPNGVNVRSSGSTSVFLTFQNLAPNEDSQESFFCGELIAPLPANHVFDFNPCNPATIFGRLPNRLDRSQLSGTGGRRNLTDIMTIPSSVTRRAFQAAQSGSASQFFYVRRFSSGQFAVVTCRMAGGGARSPLALTDVRIGFLNGQDELILDPVYPVTQGATLPPFGARIKYNGTGRLKGRWEVVQPGDNTPTEFDLLTAATLPAEERSLQRRYTVLERFDVYLTPVGEVFLPGPRTLQPPTEAGGLHLVLLRIEASDARDSRSNTGNGLVVNAGGVAGFPMPVLRYFVGAADSNSRQQTPASTTLALVAPAAQSSLAAQSMQFSWSGTDDAGFYRLEVQDDSGVEVLSAILPTATRQYTAPPWLAERAGENLRWRIVALDAGGSQLRGSNWQDFSIESN
ncbi:MAG: hypothetical protein KDK04_11425 [Candidatus Competibacteraceae bacterium]|nr:hypothetical protein [Candidatus Competibacteraceae bacterium]MCB1812311.1 hypothetical protein [Candidatus Competibacteraceae bacterium]